MKKNKVLLSVISIFLIIVLSSAYAFAAEISNGESVGAYQTSANVEYLAGDVDGNGIVDVNDVTVYQLTLVGKLDETPAFQLNSNTYTDKQKNVRDVTAIQLYLINILRKIPITPDGYYSEILRP